MSIRIIYDDKISLFDENKKIKVDIDRTVIVDCKYQINDASIEQFYNTFTDIVKKNKSKVLNTAGYYTSHINTSDFQTRGIYNYIINTNLRVPFEALENYEAKEEIQINDEKFKILFNELDSLYENLKLTDTDFIKGDHNYRLKVISNWLVNNYNNFSN